MGIPHERLQRLLALAREAVIDEEEDRSQEYIRLARRIAERHRIPLSRKFKRSTCDACDRYLRPGVTVQTRLRDGHVVQRCVCGAIHRYPYN
jgi:ribonuclease P protein subunit RPR2